MQKVNISTHLQRGKRARVRERERDAKRQQDLSEAMRCCVSLFRFGRAKKKERESQCEREGEIGVAEAVAHF